MRNNQPVTGREHRLPERAVLMSVTDPNGKILHANDSFVSASGFSREALMGQPHNIVRHPDMPPAAFADMWQTLAGGEPWTALVKNRRADGDHYWVRANATPQVRKGQLVGYLSVRTRPTADEVQAAEACYAAMREDRLRGWALRKGVLVRTGWAAPLTWGRWWPLRSRLWLAAAIAGLMPPLAATLMGASGAGALAAWAAGAAAVAAAGIWLERQVDAPLQALVAQAKAVAIGDPSEPVLQQRSDELGMLARSVNQAGLNLRALMDDVGRQVDGLRSAAGDIATGNHHLSGRTVATAASLQQTAAAMEELQVTITQSADTAREASTLATDASRSASEGGTLVGGVAGTIAEIHDSARQIGELIGEIDAIAFQTNLLALNAAVESARAGEAGRGFAVVAGEVRALAQRSADAARQIGRLVRGSLERVDAGQNQVSAASAAMAGIVGQAAKVDQLLETIHRAVAEQATGMEQVNLAMGQIDQGTQQNAGLVEESAASAERIRQRADDLAAAVRVFEVG